MSTRAEQEAEFAQWWSNPDRDKIPSPVLRALMRGEQHYMLDEHETAFPADMGIRPATDAPNPPSYAKMRADIKKRFSKTLAYLAK